MRREGKARAARDSRSDTHGAQGGEPCPTPGAIAAVLLAIANLSLAGCAREAEAPRFVGTLERDRIEIVSEALEPIVAIAVREGEKVQQGQLLLRQDTAAAAAQLAQAQASIAQAQRHLDELQRGPRIEEIDAARAAVAAARAVLEQDARELVRIEELVARRLTSQADADRARANRDRSRAALDEARARLTALERGTRSEQIDQARATLEAAQAAARELEVGTGRLEVHATRAGLVEALPYEVGERPPRGAPVAVLLASDAPAYARIYVPEPLRATVTPGAPARIFVDGRTAPLDGRVRFVAAEASFTPYFALTQRDRSRLVFLAEVAVSDREAESLPVGVPVEVEIAGNGL